MSKAVMLSIQPKWCELIASGKKTIEVRKTIPKLEPPFKCYVYETRGKPVRYSDIAWEFEGRGKVIGEFMCDKIYDITPHFDVPTFPNQYIFEGAQEKDSSCLSFEEINSYLKRNQGYGLHISDLVIYDKPKELSEFYRLGNPLICDGRNCENCNHLKYMQVNSDEWNYDCDCQHQLENRITLKRPPQSWCYVEELK